MQNLFYPLFSVNVVLSHVSTDVLNSAEVL